MLVLGAGKFQAFNASTGLPLNGGKVYTYEAGTTTAKASYPTVADAQATTNANANPVILDSNGMATIVLLGPTKVVLKDSSDNTVWTVDSLDTSASASDVVDGNGNYVLRYNGVSTAVNYLSLTNSITGVSPTIASAGSDTNVGIKLNVKGTAGITSTATGLTFTNSTAITDATSGAAASVKLYEATANGTNKITVTLPTSLVSDYTLTLPSAVPASTVPVTITSAGVLAAASTDITMLNSTSLVDATATVGSNLVLKEGTNNGTNKITFTAPASLAADLTMTLPNAYPGSTLPITMTTGGTMAYMSASPYSSFSISQTVFTTSGTYTPNANMRYAFIEVLGCGGGGGGCNSASTIAAAGGGGAGGYVNKMVSAAQVGASATVTIGTAGAGGSAGTNNGSAGGNCSAALAGSGSITLAANGGSGGTGAASVTTASLNAGGSGGTSSGGTINNTGEAGQAGSGVNVSGSIVIIGGQGGSSLYGNGGKQALTAAAGNAAGGYGAGGAGAAASSGVDRAGGAGTGGLVVVTEYILS